MQDFNPTCRMGEIHCHACNPQRHGSVAIDGLMIDWRERPPIRSMHHVSFSSFPCEARASQPGSLKACTSRGMGKCSSTAQLSRSTHPHHTFIPCHYHTGRFCHLQHRRGCRSRDAARVRCLGCGAAWLGSGIELAAHAVNDSS